MAVSAGTAALQVVPTLTKTFSRDLATQLSGPVVKGADKTGKESGRKFGASFSGGIRTGIGPVRGFMRGFGPALAASFGATALVAGVKAVTDEAREAAIVGKQTAAVLKSTGGAANISAKGVEQLAQALSNKVGVDDEAIQSSQNLLLTFTGIRNEAGKGNDIFNQSSAAILDMTAAMNKGNITSQGLKASTIQVGKALNDPIKGMTALSRVGVTFTDQQKDQIKALVESGDKLGAQRIILAELRKEFGGSAAASADAGKRFGVFIGNLKEQVGAVLLPILNKLLGFLVDKLPGAFRAVGGAIGTVVTAFNVLVGAFKDPDVTSSGFFGALEKIGSGLRALWDTIVRLVVPAFRSIADSLKPAIAAFVSGLLPGLKSLWHVIQNQVFPALKIVAAIIGVTLFAALKFVLPLLLRIAGPVLGFLFKQLAQTIQWISNVVRWIGNIGAAFLRWITGTKTTGDAVKKLAETAAAQFRAIGGAVKTMWEKVIRPTFTFLIQGFLKVVGAIIQGAADAFGWVPGVGPKLKGAAKAFDRFAGDVNKALGNIDDEGVNVKLKSTFQPPKGFSMHSIVGAQRGIRLPGYGGGDRIPAMLEAGEAVVPKHAVKDRGFQAWAASQGIPGFQSGGYVNWGSVSQKKWNQLLAAGWRGDPTDRRERLYAPGYIGMKGRGLRLRVEAFSPKKMARTQEAINAEVARKTAAGIARNHRLLLGAGISGGVGGTGVGGTVGFAANAWRIFRAAFGLPMGGRAPRSNPSDHPIGKAIDIMTTNRALHRAIIALGQQLPGAKYWISYRRIGHTRDGFDPRYYGGPSPHTDHVHWSFYRKGGRVADRGAVLSPGLNLLDNRTGRPEPLVPAGGAGITVNVTVNGAVGSPRDIAQALTPLIRRGIRDAQGRELIPNNQRLR